MLYRNWALVVAADFVPAPLHFRKPFAFVCKERTCATMVIDTSSVECHSVPWKNIECLLYPRHLEKRGDSPLPWEPLWEKTCLEIEGGLYGFTSGSDFAFD